MTKITQDWIRKQKPNGKFQRWDVDGVRGLKLIMQRTGGISWTYRYTIGKGENREFKTATLGRWPDLSPEEARIQAEALREILKKGGSPEALPAPEPKSRRSEVMEPEPEPEPGAKFKRGTYAELVETFYSEWVIPQNSISYTRQQRWKIDKFVLPKLGKLKMATVGVVAITKFLDEIKKTSIVNCNRTWTLLNKMHNWGHRRFEVLHPLPNPCTGYERAEEKVKNTKRLNEGEIRLLGEAWRASTDPRKYAVLLPLLCGCRRGALLCLDKGVINREAKVIVWPEDVEGMKATDRVYLSTSALPVLDKIPEGVTTEVMAKGWAALRKKSGVDCCIHDLRRTFTSIGTDLEISQYLIDALIHTGGETNKLIKIYQIVGEDKLAETAETIGEHIAGLLGIAVPKPDDSLVPEAEDKEPRSKGIQVVVTRKQAPSSMPTLPSNSRDDVRKDGGGAAPPSLLTQPEAAKGAKGYASWVTEMDIPVDHPPEPIRRYKSAMSTKGEVIPVNNPTKKR